MLDAYTLKKIVPRLVIGVVLVNISWYICVSLLETTSVIANSLESLLWAPFESSTVKELTIGDQLSVLLWGGIAIGAFPAAMWVTIGGGWAVILTILLTVAAFLLLALIILTLREIVIIFLIIISPVALVLWVLPGTEQWAKRWWGLFTKLLLMFPVFVGLLAMGQIMSALTNKHTGDNGSGVVDTAIISPIENLIAIVMYIIPFFMLPFLFKAMGGFLGQISGMINDKEKGLLDRSKNWSKDKTGTSILNAEKSRRKELGAAERKRAGDSRVLNRPRTGWQSIQHAATGGRLGKGVGEADVEALRAQEQQEEFRAQTARRSAFEAGLKGRQLDITNSRHDTEGSIATYTDSSGTTHSLDHGQKDELYTALAQGNKVTVKDATGKETLLDGSDESVATAATYNLASLGRDGAIVKLMDTSNPENINVRQHIVRSAVNDNTSALVGKAPDMIKGPAAFDKITASDLSGFSEDTIDRAFNHVKSKGPQQQQALLNELDKMVKNEQIFDSVNQKQAGKIKEILEKDWKVYGGTIATELDKKVGK